MGQIFVQLTCYKSVKIFRLFISVHKATSSGCPSFCAHSVYSKFFLKIPTYSYFCFMFLATIFAVNIKRSQNVAANIESLNFVTNCGANLEMCTAKFKNTSNFKSPKKNFVPISYLYLIFNMLCHSCFFSNFFP